MPVHSVDIKSRLGGYEPASRSITEKIKSLKKGHAVQLDLEDFREGAPVKKS